MSKVDAQRAMREARYAARTSRSTSAAPPAAPAAPTPPRAAAAPAVRVEPSVVPAAAPGPGEGQPELAIVATAADAALCGHRNMSNKSCQRPAGHAEKSHRYR